MRLLLSTIVMTGMVVSVAAAQSRDALTVLGRSDTSEQGQEAVAAVDDLAPGARASWHRHPGAMVAFVADGVVTVEQAGGHVATYQAGESFIIPAHAAHSTVNNGTIAARMFVTFIVPKDEPLTSRVRPSAQ